MSSQYTKSNGSETQDRLENAVAQDISNSTGTGSTTNTRSAYDSADYQPHDKIETSSSGDNTSNGITSANGHTVNNSDSSNINSAMDHAKGIHSGRMHGNIGVTNVINNIARPPNIGSTTPDRLPSRKAFFFVVPLAASGIEIIAPSGKF